MKNTALFLAFKSEVRSPVIDRRSEPVAAPNPAHARASGLFVYVDLHFVLYSKKSDFIELTLAL